MNFDGCCMLPAPAVAQSLKKRKHALAAKRESRWGMSGRSAGPLFRGFSEVADFQSQNRDKNCESAGAQEPFKCSISGRVSQAKLWSVSSVCTTRSSNYKHNRDTQNLFG